MTKIRFTESAESKHSQGAGTRQFKIKEDVRGHKSGACST